MSLFNLSPQLQHSREAQHIKARTKDILNRQSATRCSYIKLFSKDTIEQGILDLANLQPNQILHEFSKFTIIIKECSESIELDTKCFDILINAIEVTSAGWQFLFLLCQRLDPYQLYLLGNHNLIDQIEKACKLQNLDVSNMVYIVKIIGWISKYIFKNCHKQFLSEVISICQKYPQDLLGSACFMFERIVKSYNNEQHILEFLQNNMMTYISILESKHCSVQHICEGFASVIKIKDFYLTNLLIGSDFFKSLVRIIESQTQIINLSSSIYCLSAFVNLTLNPRWKHAVPVIFNDMPKIIQIAIKHLHNYEYPDNLKLKLICLLRIILTSEELHSLISAQLLPRLFECLQYEMNYYLDEHSDEFSEAKIRVNQTKAVRANTIQYYLVFFKKYLSNMKEAEFYGQEYIYRFVRAVQDFLSKHENIPMLILSPCLEVLNLMACHNLQFRQDALHLISVIQKSATDKDYVSFKIKSMYQNLISL